MRVPEPILPRNPDTAYLRELVFALTAYLRRLSAKTNAIGAGSISGYEAATAAPTTGTYARGDFILNSQPAELGSAGSKYIVHGFRCVSGGTPGTWVEVRTLTGA